MLNLQRAAFAAIIVSALVSLPAVAAATGSTSSSPPRMRAITTMPAPQKPVTQVSTAVLIGAEDCKSFDPASVKAGGGMVISNSGYLLNFYGNSQLAKRAAEVIQSYGFTQQCFVGHMPGEMMYWKVGGSVPANLLSGADCVPVSPETAFVSNAGGTWLAAAPMPLAKFAQPNRSGAERAVQLIKAYKFRHQCRIGGSPMNSPMTWWLLG